MDTVIISSLAALAGLAAPGINTVELLVRLRWQERQQHAHSCLTALVRALPREWRLEEIRAEGSDLRLVITHVAEPAERPSRCPVRTLREAPIGIGRDPGRATRGEPGTGPGGTSRGGIRQ